MTDRDALLALADRVEACVGPDREVDQDIHEHIVIQSALSGTIYPHCKKYTASIDAAMTLVPDGLFPTIDFVTHRCWLRTAEGYDVFHGPAYGFGRHVPTSIAAASLRALAGERG